VQLLCQQPAGAGATTHARMQACLRMQKAVARRVLSSRTQQGHHTATMPWMTSRRCRCLRATKVRHTGASRGGPVGGGCEQTSGSAMQARRGRNLPGVCRCAALSSSSRSSSGLRPHAALTQGAACCVPAHGAVVAAALRRCCAWCGLEPCAARPRGDRRPGRQSIPLAGERQQGVAAAAAWRQACCARTACLLQGDPG
jgi:hypothetical protein